MVDYEHTQIGTRMRTGLAGCALVATVIALLMARYEPSSARIPAVAAAILGICLFVFHSLTVRVSRDEIALRFGIGLIRKRFAVADVESARGVRNRWYYGWGVRWTSHGWSFTVSGFDVVEIKLKDGGKYRIGTDQPAELLAAIEAATA